MTMLSSFSDAVSLAAHTTPERVGAADLERSMTFAEWDWRASRLAQALLGLGMQKNDRIAVLAYNCIEWLEIYAAAARAGVIAVPINFRLVTDEMRYIIEDCGARFLIIQDALIETADAISDVTLIHFGAKRMPAGCHDYEDLIARASDRPPSVPVSPDDTWTLMYTSGTTGRPKGAIRSHQAGALLSLTTDVELGFSRRDTGLLVMPMCHANSLYFMGALTFCGAPVRVYSRTSFDPEHLLRTLAAGDTTFTSLVPTHYVMMLGLEQRSRDAYRPEHVRRLMISSAPARRDTKAAILAFFENSGLFELYGSTEQGWATMLQPEEQFEKLGSVGRECVGSKPIKLLDDHGNEVADGEVGELYSATPYAFDGYWNLPEKTTEAFLGDYLTVGDLATRDADGYYMLVDRKNNMIISGGENVYPSEVENALGAHGAVKDVAVIGAPDDKWGERVHGFVVLHPGADVGEAELIAFTRDRLAGYKRPRSLSIIPEDEMPRNATGKILHRVLRDKIATDDSVNDT